MVKLNNSPVLSLSEIIVQLFNNKFLSDCVYTFENDTRILHTHRFLLCARSIVFEKQFQSISDQEQSNQFPIPKYSYETFSEFIRFVYTDECTISKENLIAMLELAVKYRIPKLENIVNQFIIDHDLNTSEKFRIFEFCVIESYELLYGWIAEFIGTQLSEIIKSDYFLEIEADTVEAILKMDTVGTWYSPVHEIDLFKALIRWLGRDTSENNPPLDERRRKFDKLKWAIRFPVMLIFELKEVLHQHEDLLSNLDLVSFFKSTNGQEWNSNKRNTYSYNPNDVSNSKTSPKLLPVPAPALTTQKDEPNKISSGSSNLSTLFPKSENFNFKIEKSAVQPTNNQHIATFTPDKELLITGLWLNTSSLKLTSITVNCGEVAILKLPVKTQSNIIFLSLGESVLLEADKQCKIMIEGDIGLQMSSASRTRDVIRKEIATCLRDVRVDDKVAEIFVCIPVS